MRIQNSKLNMERVRFATFISIFSNAGELHHSGNVPEESLFVLDRRNAREVDAVWRWRRRRRNEFVSLIMPRYARNHLNAFISLVVSYFFHLFISRLIRGYFLISAPAIESSKYISARREKENHTMND